MATIRRKAAWVSGGKVNGYRLHVDGDMFPLNDRDMVGMDGIYFDKYRAAQDIANAVNAYLKRLAK